jgi:hypothetical protein
MSPTSDDTDLIPLSTDSLHYSGGDIVNRLPRRHNLCGLELDYSSGDACISSQSSLSLSLRLAFCIPNFR